MTAAAGPIQGGEVQPNVEVRDLGPAQSRWRQILRSRRVVIGGGVLLGVLLLCIATLPWTLYQVKQGIPFYTFENDATSKHGPDMAKISGWFGYDKLGRSILARSLFGGTISLAVGLAAATISVVLGVAVGLLAGYRGGWVDSALMRTVDILYGLPYVLLVILFKVAFEKPLEDGVTWAACFGVVMLVAALLSLASAAGRSIGIKWAMVTIAILLAIGAIFLLRPTSTVSSDAPSTANTGPTTVATAPIMASTAPTTIAIAPTTTTAPTTAATTQTTAPAATIKAGAAPAPRNFAFKLKPQSANLVVLFSAIGLVSWLTMARVVRGQVLSLRGQPFIEACRAMGVKEGRIFLRHILPNLIGPITVYATLTVPSAILQESFLSFLGVGVNPPLATWGSLASEGVEKLSPLKFYWWLLVFPCTLLAVTLLSLNFLGDGLRDVFDPKKEAAKI